MISNQESLLHLTSIYIYVSDLYNDILQYSVAHFSNNHSPLFSDAEVMTVYLYVSQELKLFKIKDIHRYI